MSDNLQDAAVNVLKTQTRNFLQIQGIKIDTRTAPYKDFDKDRFYIQKCIDSGGNEVVAKVSLPDDWSRDTLKRESSMYKYLQEILQLHFNTGSPVDIHFPHLVKQFQTDLGQEVLVTEYIHDDKELKERLTRDEKSNILISIIQELHKLRIPDKVDKNIITIHDSDKIQSIWEQDIGALCYEAFIDKRLGQNLRTLTNSFDVLKVLPLKIAHGDVHTSNIALTLHSSSKQIKVTLMDIENLRISNEFSDLAQILNRKDIYSQMLNSDLDIPENTQETFKKVLFFLEDPKIVEKFYQNFVTSHLDHQALLLMRIFDAEQELFRKRNRLNEMGKFMSRLYISLIEELLNQFSSIQK